MVTNLSVTGERALRLASAMISSSVELVVVSGPYEVQLIWPALRLLPACFAWPHGKPSCFMLEQHPVDQFLDDIAFIGIEP